MRFKKVKKNETIINTELKYFTRSAVEQMSINKELKFFLNGRLRFYENKTMHKKDNS